MTVTREFDARKCRFAGGLVSTGLLAALSACAGPYVGGEWRPPRPVVSLIEQRQENVVLQRWDLSCGAASLATILNFQHDDPVTEREIAYAMLSKTDPEKVKTRLGFSLLDLKRYAQSRGYVANGYGSLSVENLAQFGPTIVPVRFRDYDHFVVFRGVRGDRVLLADPAYGNRTMPIEKFEQAWVKNIGFTVAARDGRTAPNRLAPNPDDFPASSLLHARLPEISPAVQLARANAGQSSAKPADKAPPPQDRAEPKSESAEDRRAPGEPAPAASAIAVAHESMRQTGLGVQSAGAAETAAQSHRKATSPLPPAEAIPPTPAPSPATGPRYVSSDVTVVTPPPSAAAEAIAAGGRAGPNVLKLLPAVAPERPAAKGFSEGIQIAEATRVSRLPVETPISLAPERPPEEPDLAKLESDLTKLLIARGDKFLQQKDAVGARLYYERAAAIGSAAAALALAATYDPQRLAELGIRGGGDPAKAAEWRQRAAALGAAGSPAGATADASRASRPPVATPMSPAPERPSDGSDLTKLLIARGDQFLLQQKDAVGARLYYERAAAMGSAAAALALAGTYDPRRLAELGIHGGGDPAKSAEWSRRAAVLGGAAPDSPAVGSTAAAAPAARPPVEAPISLVPERPSEETDLTKLLIARGDQFLQQKDAVGARLYYERAAAIGSAAAALALAGTYDPQRLAELGIHGGGDPAKAAEWLQRAAVLGAGGANRVGHRLSN